jgi:hypothetical protein
MPHEDTPNKTSQSLGLPQNCLERFIAVGLPSVTMARALQGDCTLEIMGRFQKPCRGTKVHRPVKIKLGSVADNLYSSNWDSSEPS